MNKLSGFLSIAVKGQHDHSNSEKKVYLVWGAHASKDSLVESMSIMGEHGAEQ